MQPVVYHGFCSRASGERSPRHRAISGLANRSSCFGSNRLPQIRRESFFHCPYVFISPRRVINCLIASNLSDPEIFRFWMRKIEPADAGAGMHCKRFR